MNLSYEPTVGSWWRNYAILQGRVNKCVEKSNLLFVKTKRAEDFPALLPRRTVQPIRLSEGIYLCQNVLTNFPVTILLLWILMHMTIAFFCSYCIILCPGLVFRFLLNIPTNKSIIQLTRWNRATNSWLIFEQYQFTYFTKLKGIMDSDHQ